MKRNQRSNPHFFSTCLPLFAVAFLVVATFPADVLAARRAITIKNDGGRQLNFETNNGKDSSCTAAYENVAVYGHSQKKIHCDAQGTGTCKLAGWDSKDSAQRGVYINDHYTEIGFGCGNKVRVAAGSVVTCKNVGGYFECHSP